MDFPVREDDIAAATVLFFSLGPRAKATRQGYMPRVPITSDMAALISRVRDLCSVEAEVAEEEGTVAPPAPPLSARDVRVCLMHQAQSAEELKRGITFTKFAAALHSLTRARDGPSRLYRLTGHAGADALLPPPPNKRAPPHSFDVLSRAAKTYVYAFLIALQRMHAGPEMELRPVVALEVLELMNQQAAGIAATFAAGALEGAQLDTARLGRTPGRTVCAAEFNILCLRSCDEETRNSDGVRAFFAFALNRKLRADPQRLKTGCCATQ